MSEVEPASSAPVVAARLDRQRRVDRIFGAAIIVLAVASVLVITVYVVRLSRATTQLHLATLELKRITDCHNRYIDALKTANIERSEAAAEDRAANRDLFVTAAQSAGNRAAQQEAFELWLRRTAAADQKRSENPVPTERCG